MFFLILDRKGVQIFRVLFIFTKENGTEWNKARKRNVFSRKRNVFTERNELKHGKSPNIPCFSSFRSVTEHSVSVFYCIPFRTLERLFNRNGNILIFFYSVFSLIPCLFFRSVLYFGKFRLLGHSVF